MSAPNYTDSDIAQLQAAHRRAIVDSWNIRPGWRVLEIGSGQGDLTVVLAEIVGESGQVTAVDVANREYGSPLTLGEATDLIKAGPLGERIDFMFEFDLATMAGFLNNFDAAVMAHSAWYFPNRELLRATLAEARRLAPKLCFAEWDLEVRTPAQEAHRMAAVTQGRLPASDELNIRNPLTRPQFRELFAEVGWRPVIETIIDSRGLPDADWEIDTCLRHKGVDMSRLRMTARPKGNMCLDTFSIVAERA